MASDETKVEISIEASQNTGAVTTAGANVEALKVKLDELVNRHHGDALKEDMARYEEGLRGVQPSRSLLHACGSADWIIESVPEDLALKQRLFENELHP